MLYLIILYFCNLFLAMMCLVESVDIDPNKSIVWGPGLRPDTIVLPARYFFVQLVDINGQNVTKWQENDVKVVLRHHDKAQRCRVGHNLLMRDDGSFIIRYKLYQPCSGLLIDLQFKEVNVAGFPLIFKDLVLSDDCNCPKNIESWRSNLQCPPSYNQIERDLSPFPHVDMSSTRQKIRAKFNKTGSMSICHYIVKSNDIYRKCYGQHVGFHIFMDSMLLSLARKVKLPDLELFVNLGDWPLETNGPNPLPIFSWCGSEETADIVMPTYDITESTLECMGRVQLDMLSVQGNTGPQWSNKQGKAFWRGRDSRIERLELVNIARTHPHLFNVSLTNFFFFRDKEDQYGPKQPHVSFFNFFDYKYQICVDGTVAAYRFPYLLVGNSLVLKQESNYYEHFYKDLQAGVHYLPIKRNLSNLVDQLKWAIENDSEAQKIARQGSLFARNNLMPNHIFCYHTVLFHEWSKRLSSRVDIQVGMDQVKQPEGNSLCDCGLRHSEL